MVEVFFLSGYVRSFLCVPWFKGFKGWRNWKLKVRTFKFDLCFDFFQVFDKVSKTAEKQVLFKVPSWKQKVWNGESSVWVGYGAMKWSWFRSNMESSKLKNRDSTLRVPKLNPNRYLGIHSDPIGLIPLGMFSTKRCESYPNLFHIGAHLMSTKSRKLFVAKGCKRLFFSRLEPSWSHLFLGRVDGLGVQRLNPFPSVFWENSSTDLWKC